MKGLQRKTIGLFIRELDVNYNEKIWHTVIDYAREKNVNVLVFTGKSHNSPVPFEKEHNIIYNLATPYNLDGIILTSGAMSLYNSNHEYQRFYQRYKPLPMVSIGLPEEDIPSILLNSKKGMRELMDHLIKFHGKRRIAFIQGPHMNPDAISRFEEYMDALFENHLEFQSELVAEGDFTFLSGSKAVLELLNRKVRFDALVCANDNMALAAMEVLQSKKIVIPRDVVVAGFDDLDEADFSTPALTTVRQPLEEQARKAMDVMIDLMEGKKTGLKFCFDSSLVVRESCGCLDSGCQDIHSKNVPVNSEKKLEEQLSEWHELTGKSIRSFYQSQAGKEGAWMDQALLFQQCFYDDMLTKTDRKLADELNTFIINPAVSIGELEFYYKVVLILKQKVDETVSFSAPFFNHAQEIAQSAAKLIMDKLFKQYQYYQYHHQKKFIEISNIAERIIDTGNAAELKEALENGLTHLNVQLFAVFLYQSAVILDDQAIPAPPQLSQFFAGFDESGVFKIQNPSEPFLSGNLFPEGFLPEDRFLHAVVMPLLYKTKHFGYVLFEISDRDPFLYKVLQEQISKALDCIYSGSQNFFLKNNQKTVQQMSGRNRK